MKCGKRTYFMFIILFGMLGLKTTAFSLGRPPYSIFLFTAYDWSVSNNEIDSSFPAIYWTFLQKFDENNMYIDFSIQNSTQPGIDIGWMYDTFSFGARPHFEYSTSGAYKTVVNGQSDNKRSFDGNHAGIEFHYGYTIQPGLSVNCVYIPRYHFYNKYDETEIALPRPHWEHDVTTGITYSAVSSKSMGRLKNGLKAALQCEYIKRDGYGTFRESPGYEQSDISNTFKVISDIGLFYTFWNDYDVHFTVRGVYQYQVDRNNCEEIGSVYSGNALPGYQNREFTHDRFVLSNIKIGIPIPFWEMRVQPGFTTLYMPKENRVVAVQDYPREMYTSVSLSVSFMIANTVPLFLDYAYGIDADRPGDDRSHEFAFGTVFAFGELK